MAFLVPPHELAILALFVLAEVLIASPPANAQQPTTVSAEKAVPPVANGNYYALVIGIDEYPPPLPRLKTSVSDAQAIGEVLKEQYGFEVKYILDKDATRSNILRTFLDYRNTLHENDNVLIYYAGHSYFDREMDRAYWVPFDGSSDNSSNLIGADEIVGGIRVLSARHVLIMSDSGFSGGLSRGAGPEETPLDEAAYIKRMLRFPSRSLMASGSIEPVADESAGNHSVFANAVLHGLEQSQEIQFTAADLFFKSVRAQVARRSEQIPSYSTLRNSMQPNSDVRLGDFVFTRSAKSSSDVSSRKLDGEGELAEGRKFLERKDYTDAIPPLVRACAAGTTSACSDVAFLYSSGLGVDRDPNRALGLYQTACDGDNIPACTALGEMYAGVRGVTQDPVKARHLFEISALQGDSEGESDLGSIYFKGEGVPKDYVKARRYLESADAQGNLRGAENLARIYEIGLGIPVDLLKARVLYQKAVKAGDEKAKDNLASVNDKIADEVARRAEAESGQEKIGDNRGFKSSVEPGADKKGAASSANGKSYALLFATNTYRNWGNLNNPIPDADALAEELQSTFNFESASVVTDASSTEVKKELTAFLNKPYGAGDQLLIFFAGHGTFEERWKLGFLATTEAANPKDDPYHETLLSYDLLNRMIGGSGASHVLLVLDACFSGTIDRRISESKTRSPNSNSKYAQASLEELIEGTRNKTTRIYIASGGKDYVPDGDPGHHSPFTAGLLATLDKNAKEKGFVTIEDLRAGLEGVKPKPVSADLDNNTIGSDFIFVTKTAARILAEQQDAKK
jgi:TPR repeat protein/uncharacterized caspase-like protein